MRKSTKKFVALLKPMALLLALILLLSVTSYAWIKRNWQPTIEEAGISVSTGGSLAFVFTDGGTPVTDALLNEYVPEFRDFSFKPVSNYSGKAPDFFNIARMDDRRVFSHLDGNPGMATARGYIDISFLMMSNEGNEENVGQFTRYVYLNSEQCVLKDAEEHGSPSAAAAVRICIDVANGGTYLLWNREEDSTEKHIAVTNDVDAEGRYVADGKDLNINNQFQFDNRVHKKNDQIKSLSHYCGYDRLESGALDTDSPNPQDRCLFSIPSGGSVLVTLRIWLEGQDPNCTDSISADKIDLKLVFDSLLVENKG